MNACSLGVLASLLAASLTMAADAAGQPPAALDYREVRGVLLSNLVGASEADLEAAAARGLIEQLAGRVTLLTNGVAAPTPEAGPTVAKATLFSPANAYIRLARIDADADAAFATAFKELVATNKIGGLVLDLRFAAGTNYAAATRLAGQFIAEAGTVMSLGGQEFAIPANDQAFAQPTIVLVNTRTSGAAEALAEALRQGQAALVLGSRTAGTAGVFDEFALSTGQRLRVVTATVKLRGGAEVPPGGLDPDIAIGIGLAEERAFLENPFAAAGRTNLAAVNRPPRLTEADLVRMRRERRDTPVPASAETPTPNTAPIVADPALARALDLLKGIAMVKKPRQM